jgi:hypothetical protein
MRDQTKISRRWRSQFRLSLACRCRSVTCWRVRGRVASMKSLREGGGMREGGREGGKDGRRERRPGPGRMEGESGAPGPACGARLAAQLEARWGTLAACGGASRGGGSPQPSSAPPQPRGAAHKTARRPVGPWSCSTAAARAPLPCPGNQAGSVY